MGEPTTAKKGHDLVQQLETFLGNKATRPTDGSYDWLIEGSDGPIHGEVKTTASKEGDYFSINGPEALRRLIEDPQYRLYFCVLGPPPVILRCKSRFLGMLMGWNLSSEARTKVRSLQMILEDLKSLTKMPFDCRVPFHLPGGIEGVLQAVLSKKDDQFVRASVDGVWELKENQWNSKFEV